MCVFVCVCVSLCVLVHMCVCMAMGQREQLRKWKKEELKLDGEGNVATEGP